MLSITIEGTTFRFYDHLYAVSRAGAVLRNLLPYEPRPRPDGYAAVGRRRLLHRMVATCWCDRPEGANHIHHKNHDKADNRASNLEWVTPTSHMSDRHKEIKRGQSMSDAGRQKLRELRTGSVTSEATKQKQREASLRLGSKPPPRPVGTKCSAEAIAKMRANSPNAAACEIHGIAYQSFSEAGRALGIKPHTLRKRCLSENFPDYKVRGE
jgi:hypothetical protein